MKKTNSKKGFTLMELVIVIAVIAILSAILVPTFSSVIGNANKTKEKADLKAAITTYISENATTDTSFDPNQCIYLKAVTKSDGTKEAPGKPTASDSVTKATVFVYKNGEIAEEEVTLTGYAIGDAKPLSTTEWYYFTYTKTV